VLLLGSMMTVSGLLEPGFAGLLLIPVLLLVIRPLSTQLSFAGSTLSLRERGFVGWFGIRGIGSFYYVAVAIDAGVLSDSEARIVFWTVVACAGVSILAHGLTAASFTRRLPG